MIGVNPNLHQEDMSLPQCSEDCHVGAVALSDLWHLWCINFVHSENKQTLLPGYYERFHIWKWNSPWKISIQDDSQHLRKPVKWIMQHVFRQPFYGCFLRSTTDRYLVWFLDISKYQSGQRVEYDFHTWKHWPCVLFFDGSFDVWNGPVWGRTDAKFPGVEGLNLPSRFFATIKWEDNHGNHDYYRWWFQLMLTEVGEDTFFWSFRLVDFLVHRKIQHLQKHSRKGCRTWLNWPPLQRLQRKWLSLFPVVDSPCRMDNRNRRHHWLTAGTWVFIDSMILGWMIWKSCIS